MENSSVVIFKPAYLLTNLALGLLSGVASEESNKEAEAPNPYASVPPPEGTEARLSYERLLVSASEHFTARGPDASLAEVARDAGVGNSTLSRWFPTRDHLIVAVSERHVQEIAEKCDELTRSLPPGDAVMAWIRFLIAQVSSRRELVAAMFTLEAESGVRFECNRKVGAAASGLLDRAKVAGVLRTDVDARDIAALIAAVAFATESGAAEEAERFMSLMLDGLQARVS
jgi:AcrR family transcriptional regulator